jgi:hypothetical protein
MRHPGLMLLCLILSFRVLAGGVPPRPGIVKNADTGEAMFDAYVVVNWEATYGIGHGVTSCYRARFAKTGGDGNYLVPGWVDVPKPFCQIDFQGRVTVYKPGYRGPHYGEYNGRRLGEDALTPFTGTAHERLVYLQDIARDISCLYEDKEILPVYKAIYEEARGLVASDEDRELANRLCDDIAGTETRGDADPDRDLGIARYLNDHYPECLRPEHFMEAATAGDYDGAARMLDNGLDPDAGDEYRGPLYRQVMYSQKIDVPEKTRYLLLLTGKGGNPYLAERDGSKPIVSVIRDANRGEPDKVALAVAMIETSSRNAYFRAMPYQLRFEGVMETVRPEILDAFIRAGFRVNEPIEDDLDLLMTNTRVPGRSPLIRVLVERGADLNLKDRDGRTALHAALTTRESSGYASELVRNGADVNAQDKHGRTPLFYAVSINDREQVKELLESGADPRVRDERGRTALWYARMQDRTDYTIVRLLALAEQSKPERDAP